MHRTILSFVPPQPNSILKKNNPIGCGTAPGNLVYIYLLSVNRYGILNDIATLGHVGKTQYYSQSDLTSHTHSRLKYAKYLPISKKLNNILSIKTFYIILFLFQTPGNDYTYEGFT